MTPRLRKLTLTAHITFSVGWLGLVAGFLVLAITGLTSKDTQVVRAVNLAMALIGRYVIVPVSIAALLTGLVQALGTRWGLFRHYWVLAKFLLTTAAIIVLLVHVNSLFVHAANSASGAAQAPSGGHHGALPLQLNLVVASGASLLVLLTTTTLAVFKPAGRTRHGQRQLSRPRTVLRS